MTLKFLPIKELHLQQKNKKQNTCCQHRKRKNLSKSAQFSKCVYKIEHLYFCIWIRIWRLNPGDWPWFLENTFGKSSKFVCICKNITVVYFKSDTFTRIYQQLLENCTDSLKINTFVGVVVKNCSALKISRVLVFFPPWTFSSTARFYSLRFIWGREWRAVQADLYWWCCHGNDIILRQRGGQSALWFATHVQWVILQV